MSLSTEGRHPERSSGAPEGLKINPEYRNQDKIQQSIHFRLQGLAYLDRQLMQGKRFWKKKYAFVPHAAGAMISAV